MWIDTHVHLDAAEFDGTGPDGVQRTPLGTRADARDAGVRTCVIPAVEVANMDRVRELAHACSQQVAGCDDWYALGIHPLYVARAGETDLQRLREQLERHRSDPRLVAVGEIGLDFLVPALCTGVLRERQWWFYVEQLKLAREFDLPVILHVRRSADMLLKGLRRWPVKGGIVHAFNGSTQQALDFVARGLRRLLASTLPLHAIVLETDAPDIPPQWLYQTAALRAQGHAQGVNAPVQLPRIGAMLAQLRSMSEGALAQASSENATRALFRPGTLLD
jgi:TatD DNase family protein